VPLRSNSARHAASTSGSAISRLSQRLRSVANDDGAPITNHSDKSERQ
jgi:hypothetical protein